MLTVSCKRQPPMGATDAEFAALAGTSDCCQLSMSDSDEGPLWRTTCGRSLASRQLAQVPVTVRYTESHVEAQQPSAITTT
jgi:hypothetical protein